MMWEEYQKKLPSRYYDKDSTCIKKAFLFAEEIHKDQKRLTGEPYINHSVNVSLKIAELKLYPQAVAAALLHDVTEDKNIPIKTLRKEFGSEIAFLVEGLTKVDKVRYHGKERNAESVRKMFIAMAQDISVVIIKLCDRLDNLETLYVFPAEKQKRIAFETLEIYAPVADRLGMGEIKLQLEDEAFKYAYPDEYAWIIKETKSKIPERQNYLAKIIPIIEKEIKKEGVHINSIHYRAKHYYSLWKKLLRYNLDWSLIYDLAAIRIIVNSVEDCYAVLGIVHKLWKPLPGRIKDYIALPKQNGYKSLHTTVFCLHKKVTEIQIRTQEMHDEAEYGIAAHWAWEMAGKPVQSKEMPHKKFAWLKQLQKWQKKFNKNIKSEEYLESLKIDFFKNRVFVLTPKGDVIDLPENSSIVDFAYRIHSEIGNSMTAAKVNGRLVPLSHELNSGDIVEILTQKNKKPSSKWLEFAKTPLAIHHIKASIKSFSSFPDIPKKIIYHKVEMTIMVKDRIGMIKDITAVFTSFKVNIQSIISKEPHSSYASVNLIFQEKNKDRLEKIATRLKNIRGVEEIKFKILKTSA